MTDFQDKMSAGAESPAPKRRWTFLRVALGLGLLAAVLLFVDTDAIVRILSGAAIGITLIALALFVAERVFAAVRWRMLIAGIGEAPPLGRFVSLIFSSTFLAFFLPGGVGGEIFRIYGLTRGAISIGRAVASVFVERVLALVALGMMILWGLAAAPFTPPTAVLQAVILSFAAIAFACAVIFSRRVRRIVDRLLVHPRLAKIRGFSEKLYESFDIFLTHKMLLATGFLFAIFFQLLRVVAVWVSALALGFDLPFELFLYAVPIVNLITQIPISIGGLGVREATYAALFGLAGIPAESAVALSLLTYALSVLAVTPGAYVIARRGLTG